MTISLDRLEAIRRVFKISTTISREELTALDDVYIAELEGASPFESKKRIYKELCYVGLIEMVEAKISRHLVGKSPLSVSGYRPTAAGKIVLYARTFDLPGLKSPAD